VSGRQGPTTAPDPKGALHDADKRRGTTRPESAAAVPRPPGRRTGACSGETTGPEAAGQGGRRRRTGPFRPAGARTVRGRRRPIGTTTPSNEGD